MSRLRIEGELPYNLANERDLLGALMVENSIVFDVADMVLQGDFYKPEHGELYILIKDQVFAGRPATATTLLHDMAQDRPLDGERPSVFLRTIQDNAPSKDIALELARAIRDLAIRRAIIAAGAEAIRHALEAPVTVTAEELRSEFDSTMSGLYRSLEDLGGQRLAAVGDKVIAEYERPGFKGVDVGLKAVQDLTGAFLPGRVYTLGALPGAGKSALAQQIGQYVSRDGDFAVLFSPEMKADEISQRALAAATGIPSEVIERGHGNVDDARRLKEANEALRKSGLIVDETASPSVAMIRNRVQRIQTQGRVALVVIDHVFYLASPDPRARENDSVDSNMRAIKRMAKELDVPVLALTQYTTEGIRDLNKWPHPKPNVGHLLYAGIFDRHSDVIMLLHREEAVLARNRPEEKNIVAHRERSGAAQDYAELFLTKARGRKGDGHSEFTFIAKELRFYDGKPKALIAAQMVADAAGRLPGV
jgi:replicative DNA helicase